MHRVRPQASVGDPKSCSRGRSTPGHLLRCSSAPSPSSFPERRARHLRSSPCLRRPGLAGKFSCEKRLQNTRVPIIQVRSIQDVPGTRRPRGLGRSGPGPVSPQGPCPSGLSPLCTRSSVPSLLPGALRPPGSRGPFLANGSAAPVIRSQLDVNRGSGQTEFRAEAAVPVPEGAAKTASPPQAPPAGLARVVGSQVPGDVQTAPGTCRGLHEHALLLPLASPGPTSLGPPLPGQNVTGVTALRPGGATQKPGSCALLGV